jgi:hypothetical protein
LLARLDPVSFKFCPTPILHRENFAVQIQKGFEIKITQGIARSYFLSCDDKNSGLPRPLQEFISPASRGKPLSQDSLRKSCDILYLSISHDTN